MLEAVAVITIETVFGAEPQITGTVFRNRMNSELGQPGVAIESIEVHRRRGVRAGNEGEGDGGSTRESDEYSPKLPGVLPSRHHSLVRTPTYKHRREVWRAARVENMDRVTGSAAVASAARIEFRYTARSGLLNLFRLPRCDAVVMNLEEITRGVT
jgi:hypothetical protein